jgi:hypothetical protein
MSLLWFFAGKQSLANKRPDAAIFWLSVAVVIILIACGWAVAQREWLGLAFAVAVLCIEALSIRRMYATRGGQH